MYEFGSLSNISGTKGNRGRIACWSVGKEVYKVKIGKMVTVLD
jgi:hypothetical protein